MKNRIASKSIFSLPEFLEAISIQKKATAAYALTPNDFLVPFLISTLKGIPHLYRIEFPGPPISRLNRDTEDRERSWALNEVLESISKEYHPMTLEITSRPWDPSIDLQDSRKWYIHRTSDLVIDLDKSIDDIYHGLSKRHRYTLRKHLGLDDEHLVEPNWIAQTDYEFLQGTNSQMIMNFLKLWRYTKSKMQKQRGYIASIIKQDIHSGEQLRDGIEVLLQSGHATVFSLLDSTGAPLSSAILFFSSLQEKNKFAYWSAGANHPMGLRKNSALVLQWAIIHWLKRKRFSHYYLGGIEATKPNSGPTLFKRGFKGREVSGFEMKKTAAPFNLYTNLKKLARI